MIAYLESIDNWLEITIWIVLLIVLLGTASAMIYRLVKYGMKIKVGPVEIDAEDDTAAEVPNDKQN